MSPRFDLALDPGGRRFRRILGPALLASVAVHVGLVLAAGDARISADGGSEGPPTEEASTGDDAIRAVELREPRREAIPRPPAPVVAAAPDLSDGPVVASPRLTGARLASHGAPAPSPVGRTGASTGDGASEGGSGDRTSPAVPRSLFPAWDPPASVRGRTVTVRVHVDAEGRPTGPVELRPPTPDEGFNDELRERVRRMDFRPASRNGRAVSAWAELTFEF